MRTSLIALFLLAGSAATQELRPAGMEPIAHQVPQSFFVGDIDGSGADDLLFDDNGSIYFIPDLDLQGPVPSAVTVLDGSVLPATFFIALPRFLGDIDGDGDLDVVAARQEGLFSGTNVYLMRNAGAGVFLAPLALLNTGGKPDVVRLADFNGDGLGDLIMTANSGPAGGTLEIRVQDNNGAFALAYSEPTGAGEYVVDDFDGDGYDDAFFTLGGGTGRFILGNASGTPTAGPTIPVSPVATTVAGAGDVNGDGLLDVYVLDTSTTSPFRIELFLGNPMGFLAFSGDVTPTVLGPGFFRSVASADCDADGRLDLVLEFRDGQFRQFRAYRGDDNATFSDAPITLWTGLLSSSGLGLTTGLMDLDRDEDLDAVRVLPGAPVMLERLENRALYGAACPGTGGSPNLVVGAARPGNAGFTIRIENGLPNAPAGIFIATGDVNAACGVLFDVGTLVLPAVVGPLDLVTDATGRAELLIPLPPGIPPSAPFYLQGGVLDPGGTLAVAAVTFATTRGRSLRIF
jgi:hypothetical protein